jgi:hypothetical protein
MTITHPYLLVGAGIGLVVIGVFLVSLGKSLGGGRMR